MQQPCATVVIATRNRKQELDRAIRSCMAQTARGLEILVFDDASGDGTSEFVRQTFPHVRLFTSADQVGYVHLRNRGFVEARGPIVFSLDDDAYFSEPGIVTRIFRLFATDSALAAVGIPFVEPVGRRSRSELRAGAPPAPLSEIRSYRGCAHAIRKDAALAVGGYRDFLSLIHI